MNKNLEKIHEYLKGKGLNENKLREYDSSSVYLAMEIMEYAHRNQKRENGEDYANHPSRVLDTYQRLVGIDIGYFDKDLSYKYGIPYDGVQEVCLLHDVVEDTEFSIEEVRDIYVDCGFEKYFNLYIKEALKNITHDKAVDYGDYIKICIKNPISALVKLMDMQDNLRILDLIKYDEERYKRAQGYLFWTFVLNDAYHFLENAEKYRKAIKEENL